MCTMYIYCMPKKLSESPHKKSSLSRLLMFPFDVYCLSGYFLHKSMYSIYIWPTNQTYSVVSAPIVTGSVFFAEIQVIFGTVCIVFNSSKNKHYDRCSAFEDQDM